MSLVYTNPRTQSQIRAVLQSINVCLSDLTLAIDRVGTYLGVAGEVISVGDVVRLSSGAFVRAQADSESNALAIGVVQDISGLDVRIAMSDVVVNSGWTLTPGARYFLSATTAGGLVTAPDSTTAGAVALMVGYALSTTELFVAIQQPIVY